MTQKLSTFGQARPTFGASAKLSLIGRVHALNMAWREVQHIQQLDDAALEDIGMTRAEANEITVNDVMERMGY